MITVPPPSLIRWDLSTSIRAVLFDFDGTLVDSEPLHYEAWLHAVSGFGAHTDWDDYRARFVGQTDLWAGRTFLSAAGHAADDDTVRSVCAAKHAYYRAKTPERLNIADETRVLITQGLSNLPLGIVSSSPTVDVEPTVRRAGLKERFELYVCGEHVSKHKPDPEPYHLALERLNAAGRTLEAADVLVLERFEVRYRLSPRGRYARPSRGRSGQPRGPRPRRARAVERPLALSSDKIYYVNLHRQAVDLALLQLDRPDHILVKRAQVVVLVLRGDHEHVEQPLARLGGH